jgi:predicted GIY-YIG superfamily endonuclease
MVKSGIYILKFSDKTIKCGRSKNIKARVKQYRGGSPDGQGYPKMLYLYTKYELKLEKKIHEYIAEKYERIGRLEIFKITENKHEKVMKRIIKKFGSWKDVKVKSFQKC